MTTIAYKDGIIAVDSRIVRGSMIVTDISNEKIRYEEGHVFVMAGAPSDQEHFIKSFFAGKPVVETEIDITAFVVNEAFGILYYSAVDSESRELWKQQLDRGIPTAIGSGTAYALTAMDCGCSAVDAVIMASKRDTGTGGPVRTYNLTTGVEYHRDNRSL